MSSHIGEQQESGDFHVCPRMEFLVSVCKVIRLAQESFSERVADSLFSEQLWRASVFRNLLILEGFPKFANPLTSTVPNYLEPGKGAPQRQSSLHGQ
jgi:hypothetical protein